METTHVAPVPAHHALLSLSWQIVPASVDELVTDKAAMNALLQMTKIDIATIEAARRAGV
ncbi:hypothetical protein [Luteibacter sp. UNCMF331Sha3.1]|uniref:hypothetical protein n=1 Tax=Luteibacter sp. UNCMF331Sha3.1 TaxID=1502760 RepID=UPI000B165B36|nr:hypothetical protein [Luteibacter sp. UNCMF331Sha3.1]